MINSINKNQKYRCSLDLSLHVLEIMEGILNSSKEKKIYNMTTKPDQPKYLDEDEIKLLKKN